MKKLKDAEEAKKLFLEQNPKLKDFQLNIDKILATAGTDLNDPMVIYQRMKIIKSLMRDNAQELQEMIKEFQDEIDKVKKS